MSQDGHQGLDYRGFIDSSEDFRRNRPDADVLQLRACGAPGD
jgi:hypothetical protein